MLYSTPQQILALPFLSLFPLFYLSRSSSKLKGLPERCLAGHRYAPETVPRCSLQHHRSGREKNKGEKTRTRDYETNENTAVCLSPKQKFNPNCILLKAHFTEGHQNTIALTVLHFNLASSLIFSPTHITQRAREALIRVLGWNKEVVML